MGCQTERFWDVYTLKAKRLKNPECSDAKTEKGGHTDRHAAYVVEKCLKIVYGEDWDVLWAWIVPKTSRSLFGYILAC